MIYDKVFALADSLQIEIKIYRRNNEYELRGEREFSFPLFKKTDFKVKATITASTIEDTTSSVLVKTLGDLWVFLTFHMIGTDDGILTLYLLDMKNTNTALVRKAVDGQTLETAMMAIAPTIKQVFSKGAKETAWTRVALKSTASTCVSA